jgi:DNA-binding transcriptional LysR family regulator
MNLISQSYGGTMESRPVRALDLNLLVTLNALLEERSVTRAADRVGVSQPAASAALGRLRRHFGDELLKRAGGKSSLTPLAVDLLPRTVEALQSVTHVFDAGSAFDPGHAVQEFALMMSDYAATVIGPPLTALVAARAPGVRLRLEQMEPFAAAHPAEVLRRVDGLFLPHGMISDLPAVDLFEETWVAIAAADNPAVGEVLTLTQAASLSWVTSVHGREGSTPAVQQLRAAGVEPRVAVVVDGFSAIPFLVAHTDRVALLPSRLAHRLARAADVRVVRFDWAMGPMRTAMWWHPSRHSDPAHSWLRSVVAEAGREIAGEEPPTETGQPAQPVRTRAGTAHQLSGRSITGASGPSSITRARRSR